MERQITCIQCPIGCCITVNHDGQNILSLSGNKCSKGKAYVQSELICSRRVLTSTVFCKTEKGIVPLPVKTNGEIPLNLLHEAVILLRENTFAAPVKAGDILFPDLLGTGVDVVATKDLT